MFKFLRPFFLVTLFCLSFTVSAYASNISTNTINEFSNNTSVTGKLPVVTTDSASLTKSINSKIDSIYKTRSNSAKNSNAKSITFSYNVYKNNDVTSIVIESKVSKLKSVTNVDTIVYDNSKIYALDTYLSSTELQLFNKSINNTIKNNPQDYKVSQVTLDGDTSFYVKTGVVYAVFDGETVSSNVGTTSFAFENTKVDTYTLKKSKYYVQPSTKSKYVPIREVYKNLGYDVKYKNKKTVVTDSSGKTIASFGTMATVSSIPNYTSQNNVAYIVDGVSYTKLSKVKSTTNCIYEIESDGDIVFTISD